MADDASPNVQPEAADAATALPVGSAGRLATLWECAEHLLERAGEHLNPILVKEARQSLKSRQFTVTLGLVLAAAWGWSLLAIAWIGPEAHFTPHGPGLLLGYMVILLLALVVIVPYTAFRSLAGELEDHTYELLSITSLRARQIIGGKLASSMLQVLIFLSALAPCIAFTYLLRGVDILTIVMLMIYAVLASLGLSLVGVLLASCSMDRYRQVVASVLLALGLFGLFLKGCEFSEAYIRGSGGDFQQLLIFNLVLATIYLSYFALFYLAAAAQISFASSNRSTAMRVVMVVQQALLCGWMVFFWLRSSYASAEEFIIGGLLLSGAHWYGMGIFLTGEPGELSTRVKRALPQSVVGRVLLTWFNPRAATGYVFALANFVAVGILATLAVYLAPLPTLVRRHGAVQQRVLLILLFGFCYLAIYLGLGKLAVAAVRRFSAEGRSVLLRVMLNLLLVAAGSAIPALVQMSSASMRHSGYSLLQITNPIWTLFELADPDNSFPIQLPVLEVLLPLSAVLVLLANLPSIIAEVAQVRIAKPARMQQEDDELSAQDRAAAAALPTSPWG